MTVPDDAELVRQCIEGRSHAFEVLLQRYEKPVYNVALRILGHAEDARDVAQTVFLRAWRSLDSYDPAYRFFSWIYRIAVNEALDAAGRRRPVERLSEYERSAGPSPSAALDDAQASAVVRRALAGLPPEARAVIVLRHYLGLSYREIAETLGVPEKTVKSRLFTARERLRAVLAAQGVTGA